MITNLGNCQTVTILCHPLLKKHNKWFIFSLHTALVQMCMCVESRMSIDAQSMVSLQEKKNSSTYIADSSDQNVHPPATK